jgi:hypothetical protein
VCARLSTFAHPPNTPWHLLAAQARRAEDEASGVRRAEPPLVRRRQMKGAVHAAQATGRTGNRTRAHTTSDGWANA